MVSDRPLERRIVTSLFIDIVGSTDLLMRTSPERMKRALDQAFAELGAVITEHGGTVEKFIGDAIFAVFGVPTAHADDALRALKAADACANWAKALGEDRVPFSVRIGVETGHALVDVEAAETDRERMIVGPSVNVAARLQAAAEPGDVLVGPLCRETTEGSAAFEPMGELELKGIGRVEAWRLVDTARPAVAAPPFVGRAQEIGRLREAMERAVAGRSVLAVVIGPPGQGKSRVVSEFLAGLPDVETLVARCRPESEQGSLTPLKQLLAAGGSSVPDAGSVLQRTADLFPDVAERDRVASALMHSAGVPGALHPMPTHPIEVQDEVLNGWRRYLGALARQRPVVVWIDDLHWAEPELLRLLDRLASAADGPVLIVGTARPELIGTASLRPGVDRIFIELGPLAAADSAELARRAGALAPASVERAAGNPLFIVELARSRPTSDDEIPVSVQAAIAARIDELARGDRDVLQRAAVAGDTFDLRDAALLSGRDAADVSGALGRLAHAGHITALEHAYRFQHPLVHDVAYSRLPIAERMHLHARYAEQGVDPDDAEALAHHWWRALGDQDAEWVWEDERELARLRRAAYEAHLAAGRRHSDRFAQERAVEVLGRALVFASSPEDVGTVERELGLAYARNAQGDAAWEHRMRAIAAWREAGLAPPASLYPETVAIPVFNYAFTRSMPDEALVMDVLAEGREVARSAGDDASLSMLLVCEGFYAGDLTKATSAMELVERTADPRPYADTLARLAIVQTLAGDVAAADETYRRVEALRNAGARIDELEYLAYRPTTLLLLGRIDEAADLAAQYLDLTATMGPHLRTHALQVRGTVAFSVGDWPLTMSLGHDTTRVVDDSPETPYCIRGAMATAQAAVAAVWLGDRATGEQMLERTEQMIKPGLQRSYAAFLPAVMLGRTPDPAEAMAPPGAVVRPWQRVLADPAYLMLAAGVVISGRDEARERVLDHLRLFGRNGSAVASAVADALAGSVDSLRTLGCVGLAELFTYRADHRA